MDRGRLRWATLLALALGTAAGDVAGQALTATQAAHVRAEVTAFAASVARDVTAEGPTAWRRIFSAGPAFFMASEGRLAFANSDAATAAIRQLAGTIRKIELRWGADLRVDPLTPALAVVGSTYHESRTSVSGEHVEEDGYFTGVAERRGSRWQLRDAHWSVAAPRSKVP